MRTETKPTDVYNPLDYPTLTKHLVQELMERGPFTLSLDEPFEGSGVYALFYKGALDLYRFVRSPDAKRPIYVGKAVPEGARKGRKHSGASKSLYARLRQHKDSIDAGEGLASDDFLCRYMVVTDLWITMAERFLIEHYQPVWNLCLEGFGNHDPGKKRHEGERSWWDVLHPGRPWAAKLVCNRRPSEAEGKLRKFFEQHPPGKPQPPLPADASEFMEDEE